MALGRIVFLQKKLRKIYGIEGVVGGRYIEAGFSVKMKHRTSKGVISILASKGKLKLAIDVVGLQELSVERVKDIAVKAKEVGAKPVLIVYGGRGRVREEILAKAKELGVSIKRVRS